MKPQRRISPLILALALLAASGCASASRPNALRFENAWFYDEAGAFLQERAKDAYIALMRCHGYPVYDGLREKMTVTDLGKGDFVRLGFGMIVYFNDREAGYSLMETFLLPGQMLPEHKHDATPACPPKMGGWLVRYGLSFIAGEGEPILGPETVIPSSHMGGRVNARHVSACRAGQCARLSTPGEWHWQMAGPMGAIVTEVATFHDPAGAVFADEEINAYLRRK